MVTLIVLYISAVRLNYLGHLLLFGIIQSASRSNVLSSLRATSNGFEPVSPSTWNLLVYGPPVDQTLTDIDKVTLFYNTFRDVGRVIYNEYAGDSWSKDLEFFEENKGAI